MAARLASARITHGKSSELFSGDRDMPATLKFRVQIIQKVGSSTEIKIRCFLVLFMVLLLAEYWGCCKNNFRQQFKDKLSYP